jgi:sec-independent protein translocase protein TatA
MRDAYRQGMGGLGITHWLIVLLVVVLLFGARRLPDTARGLARSLRIFRSEMTDADTAQPSRDAGPPKQGDMSVWPSLEKAGPNVMGSHQVAAEQPAPPPDEVKTAG